MDFSPSSLVRFRRRVTVLSVAALVAGGFGVAEWTEPAEEPRAEYFRTPTAHEAERLRIQRGGLARTELGRRWLREAERALRDPLPISRPHAEVGRFVRSGADALGFRVTVARGQRLEVDLEGDVFEAGGATVDLFRTAPLPGRRPVRLESPPPGSVALEHEPRDSVELLVRVQPLLLRGGDYRVLVRRVSALAFPVAGRDQGSILSVFGAPREAGRRTHHGVDIFAPRGTPVVAAASAVVRRADETPIGGKVVWLRDSRRGQSLYYAHLDSQAVGRGQRVEVGDTVGFVGNTGNARTTPPHLHFGIYRRRRGPVDPMPWIRVLSTEPPPIRADAEAAGTGGRVTRPGINLRDAPSFRGQVVAELAPSEPFRIVAASGRWYRVHLAEGARGWVAAHLVEPGLDPSAALGSAGAGGQGY